MSLSNKDLAQYPYQKVWNERKLELDFPEPRGSFRQGQPRHLQRSSLGKART